MEFVALFLRGFSSFNSLFCHGLATVYPCPVQFATISLSRVTSSRFFLFSFDGMWVSSTWLKLLSLSSPPLLFIGNGTNRTKCRRAEGKFIWSFVHLYIRLYTRSPASSKVPPSDISKKIKMTLQKLLSLRQSFCPSDRTLRLSHQSFGIALTCRASVFVRVFFLVLDVFNCSELNAFLVFGCVPFNSDTTSVYVEFWRFYKFQLKPFF